MAVSVRNRINQFRARIQDLTTDSRGIIKENLRDVFEQASDDAFQRMVAMTPQRKDEHPDVYKYRRFDGLDYIINQSPNRSIRLYGMTLKQGWVPPKIGFIGSTKNTINISTQINNIAPHAPMALLGHYSKFTWGIEPKNRQKIMFAYYNGNRPFISNGVTFNPFNKNTSEHPLGRRDIIQTGFDIINSYRRQMLDTLIKSMVEYT